MAGIDRALILSPILFIIFAWLQTASKDNGNFLLPYYSSFIFLALAVLLLATANTEKASRNLKTLFYVIVLIGVLITTGAAYSIATDPPGGTTHYFIADPGNIQLNMTYGLTSTGKPGYHAGWYQSIYNATYAVGDVYLYYRLQGLHVFTNKSIVSNATIWFWMGFWSDLISYSGIEQPITGTALHNGTESSVSFTRDSFHITWRTRLNDGYSISIGISLELEGPNYGALRATIPITESIYGQDVEVSSQLQDSVAILLSGIFLAALLSIPIKPMKPKIETELAPILKRVNSLFQVSEKTPKGFLKPCAECGKEIPIASEQCPHCGAKQP